MFYDYFILYLLKYRDQVNTFEYNNHLYLDRLTTLNTKTPNGQYQNLTSRYLAIKFKGRESIYINRTTVATKKILDYY